MLKYFPNTVVRLHMLNYVAATTEMHFVNVSIARGKLDIAIRGLYHLSALLISSPSHLYQVLHQVPK